MILRVILGYWLSHFLHLRGIHFVVSLVSFSISTIIANVPTLSPAFLIHNSDRVRAIVNRLNNPWDQKYVDFVILILLVQRTEMEEYNSVRMKHNTLLYTYDQLSWYQYQICSKRFWVHQIPKQMRRLKRTFVILLKKSLKNHRAL